MSWSRFDFHSFAIGAVAALSGTILFYHFHSYCSSENRRTCLKSSPTVPNQSIDDCPLLDSPDLDLRLIRKAEAVIRWRTSALLIVVERCTNDHNYSAILRSAEALGVQHVWIIDPPLLTDGAGNPIEQETADTVNRVRMPALKLTPQEIEERARHRLFAQNATEWLTIREFKTTFECLKELKRERYQIWATDLSQEAVPLNREDLQGCGGWPLPERLAIVFGTEAVGCTKEMLESADLRVYLPLRGYADSLNLSVATALVVHHLFLLEPSYIGAMSDSERMELRKAWFSKLARQRLLTSKEKKIRRKLVASIQACGRLQAMKDVGETLTKEQARKLSQLEEFQQELCDFDQSKHYSTEEGSVVDRVVAGLVTHPPNPLTDLRRTDTHRATFVGKNTKRLHRDHWKDMQATQVHHTKELSTAGFFRQRLRETLLQTSNNRNYNKESE